ncbi:MAG: hypothetical protein Q8R38_01315 [Candidatus Omnitrophota bacterium]|nr:hypothetical protein [Candidatus Omnitrophota bacterium]
MKKIIILLIVSLSFSTHVYGNPFGVHAPGKNDAALVKKLKADIRLIAVRGKLNAENIRLVDNYIVQSDCDFVITLDSSETGMSESALIKGRDLKQWEKAVGNLVERYDGDDDFGCGPRDRLYPSKDVRDAIKRRPIKYWQIENEWFWQIKDSKDIRKAASSQELARHFIAIRSAIKRKDPGAKIILGVLTGVGIFAGMDGHLADGYFEIGDPDYKYKKYYFKNIPEGMLTVIESMRDKALFLIKNLAPYYDVIDFHSYENNSSNLKYEAAWLRKAMEENDVRGKEIWSLENAGPFYFFPLLGLSKPEDRDTNIYDPAIHASCLIKRYVIGLDGGISKIFYSSLRPTLGWSNNYTRLSLIDMDGNKKPAYYTYKLMAEKLSGFTRINKVKDGIYKFSFEDKKPVFVLWSETGDGVVDLSEYTDLPHLKVTHIVTEEEKTDSDAVVEMVGANSVKISPAPVFCE